MCQSHSVKWIDISNVFLIPASRKRIMSPLKKNKKNKKAAKREKQSLLHLNGIKKNNRSMKIKKNSGKKKLSGMHMAMQQLYKEHSLKAQEMQCEETKKSSLNTTIDLCTDDSSCFCENIAADTSNKNEIIDLTDISPKPKESVKNSEPAVIDLSQEEELNKISPTNTGSQKNDDISVIGIFSKHVYNNRTPKLIDQNTTLPDFIPLSYSSNNINKDFNNKIKKNNKNNKNYHKKFNHKKYLETLIPNPLLAGIGENISVDAPISIPKSGLRPIIIDGSNVAFVNNKGNNNFSCKRLEICIKYFKNKGHKVMAFLPQFRLQLNKSDNPDLLRELEKQGDLILTPSKRIDGVNIVPYDDRFVVQTAVLKGGVIVSRDNFNDLLKENPAWSETIKYRTLAFTWVDDVLMFPKDPLGVFGPSLEEFLRF